MTGTRTDPRRVAVLVVLLVVAGVVWWAVRDRSPEERTPASVGADTERDIAYGSHPRQRIDVYTPDGPGPHPTVVWLHPGGWTAGDKAASMPVWDWTERGYAIVSVNYRYAVAPHTVADSIDDALAAIDLVLTDHRRWDLDPERVGVYGFSAGGHLAAMIGQAGRDVVAVAVAGAPTDLVVMLDPDATYFDGKRGEPMVEAMRALLGCTDEPDTCEERATAASPARLPAVTSGTAGSVETLVVHGTADFIVDPDQATRFHEHLLAAGAPVSFQLVPDGGHGPLVTEGGIAEFFDERLLP